MCSSTQLHQLPRPEKPLLAFPPHAAAVKFDVVPPTGAHAGDLYVALFGDEVPMTAPNGPRVGRSIARVGTVSWTLHPLASGPARRPIDVRIDAAAGWVYVLDFGQFEMTDTGVDADAGSGALWRFRLSTDGDGGAEAALRASPPAGGRNRRWAHVIRGSCCDPVGWSVRAGLLRLHSVPPAPQPCGGWQVRGRGSGSTMSLTKGSGPFGEQPTGWFNFDPHRPQHPLYVESTPRRVRVLLGGETVAESADVQLLHPPGRTPTYLFPRTHVRTELFVSSERTQEDPGMGSRTYWDIRVSDAHAPDAAYSWERPPDEAAAIAGLIAFDWDSLQVFEEDEEVFVHPRDPYTRIDVLRSSRRVRVTVADTVVAESTRPRMLLESGLPIRWYLQREDVRTELLEPSYTTTRCPYKGIAHYWSLRLPGHHETDLVWSYPEPNHDAAAVRGLLCFPQDRVQVEVSPP